MRRGWLFFWLAVLTGAYAAAVAWSGGFNASVAGVRLRSHAWERPALAAVASFLVFVVLERRRLPETLRNFWSTFESNVVPRTLLCLALAWTAVAGGSLSTYAAGGSDSYGYVSQAYELRGGHLSQPIPAGSAFTWRNAEATLVPLGYRRARTPGRMVPTYPPGLPLLMAPLVPFGERALYLLVPLFGVCLVYFTYRAGAMLGEPLAGAAAALMLSLSPTFMLQLLQPMSDVPAAACWAGAVLYAARPGLRNALAAGLFTGLAVMIRPNLAPLALIVGAVVVETSVGRVRRVALFAAPAVIAVAAVLLIQSVRYGSPLGSGYGTAGELFSLANVGENFRLYTSWTTFAYTPVIWIFLAAPLLLQRTRARPLFLALLALIAATWCAYLPYSVFRADEWFYTRFLLPAIPFMLLFACVVAIAAVRLLPREARAVAAAVFIVGFPLALGRVAIPRAADLRGQESKYPDAGRFVRDAVPANAVVLAGQHSGSVRLYAGRITVRWDLADAGDLDAIVDSLRRGGFLPYAVLDAGEVVAFREHFKGQRSIDRLRPLGEFGQAVVYTVD